MKSPYFFVMITGRIECAHFPKYVDNLYCRYILSYGPDWTMLHGLDSGISQIARRHDFAADRGIVWNFPMEASFQSTNAHGWPRIAVAAYGLDGLGRDVIRGYGSITVPTAPGRYDEIIDLYRPISGNPCQQFQNWLSGTIPEFYDTRFTTQNQGRQLVRVKGVGGNIKVIFEITTKDMKNFGYSICKKRYDDDDDHNQTIHDNFKYD